ncbi:xenobiotic-transporting atpase [Leptolyngbya sp. Heron Island J]|uniref:ABC transporter ATP-binding protein n=1 Tax=Leptolyngbya sp. Heron Island J TaxID=1385935 RepID=UPI0003B9AEC4|nr:ABC transporter ATP-binding protein [Leptolyngbya sp. Heron Island J]ESA35637.1 xenobiotic-transporting atpase [Leptolyngbya sp. Heron Island J]
MTQALWKLAESRKQQVRLGTFFYLFSAVFESTPYLFLYFILRELFSDRINYSNLIWLMVVILICLLGQTITLYWANRLTYLTSYRLIGSLRLKLGNHIRKLPLGTFTDTQVGDFNTTISQDMKNIEPFFAHVYPKLVSAIAVPCFTSMLLAFVDWRLTLAMLSGLPLALLIYFGSQKLQIRMARRQKQASVEANSRIIEYIQGIRVIKAFNQTGTRYQNLEKSLQNYKQANLKLISQLTVPVLAFAGALELGLATVLVVGVYLFMGEELTLSAFLLFLILSLRIYAPLQELVDLSTLIRMMNVALDRVETVLQTKPLPETPHQQTIHRFDIEFRNVSFGYSDQLVLNNISFNAPERSITALVGPSGSGKTTITNLIMRFWDVNSGEVLIGGTNIKDVKTDELLSKISTVFQTTYLFNDTILNNIKFGNPNASRPAIIAAAKSAQCHEFIQNLPQGYDTVIGEEGAILSGGEKQRIAIARAMLKDAPIVLLDEAAASVDPENERLIQQAINSLVQSKTLIIIAHRLSTITAADQILVIDQGQLTERGKHQDLLQQDGLYSRLWAERQKMHRWRIST